MFRRFHEDSDEFRLSVLRRFWVDVDGGLMIPEVPWNGLARKREDFRTEFSDPDYCFQQPSVFRTFPAGNGAESVGYSRKLAGFRPDLAGSGGRIHRPGYS